MADWYIELQRDHVVVVGTCQIHFSLQMGHFWLTLAEQLRMVQKDRHHLQMDSDTVEAEVDKVGLSLVATYEPKKV